MPVALPICRDKEYLRNYHIFASLETSKTELWNPNNGDSDKHKIRSNSWVINFARWYINPNYSYKLCFGKLSKYNFN